MITGVRHHVTTMHPEQQTWHTPQRIVMSVPKPKAAGTKEEGRESIRDVDVSRTVGVCDGMCPFFYFFVFFIKYLPFALDLRVSFEKPRQRRPFDGPYDGS